MVFIAAKTLDEEKNMNLNDCFHFKNIFLAKKIHHNCIHHDIFNEPFIIHHS